MTTRRIALIAALAATTAVLIWVMFVGLPRWYGPQTTTAVAPPASAPAEPQRKIKARLFYVNDEGSRLSTVETEIPYAEQPVEQAREIITAQLGASAEPMVSAIPPGTTLRALFVTEQGTAFVDLSAEVASNHPGGSTNELLTVYTIVHALALNLPAIASVQLLVDGHEVDTLAGHVDLRRPLPRNLAWLAEPGPATTQPGGPPPDAPNQERGPTDAIR